MTEIQYELIEKTSTNRGGYREGAGRPKKEETKRIRVPVGCLDQVNAVIEAYKAAEKSGQKSKPKKNTTTRIKAKQINTGQKSKPKKNTTTEIKAKQVNTGQKSKPKKNTTTEIKAKQVNTGQKSKVTKHEPPMMDSKSGQVPVKYWWTDAKGSNLYWSGRGRQPLWVKQYIAAGGKKSDLDIATWSPAGKWVKP